MNATWAGSIGTCPTACGGRGEAAGKAPGDATKKAGIQRIPAFRGAGRALRRDRERDSGRGVLQLLQRAHLDLHRGGLGGEPLLFLGERVDALALRLGRHVRSEEPTSELQSLMRT